MSKLILSEKKVKGGTLRVEVETEHLKKEFKKDHLKNLASDSKRLEKMGYKSDEIVRIKLEL